MNILILNWRDPKHPLAGGAEQSLLEHAKYWGEKGAKITWFASSYSNSKKIERIANIEIIRAGNHYTVHVLFSYYWIFKKINKNFDIIVDCFHFVPFFTPLYTNTKKIALINEVAGNLWYSNIIFPFSWVGYKVEPIIFQFYKKVTFMTASKSARNDLVKVGIKSKKIFVIPHGVLLPKKMPHFNKEITPTIIYCSRVTQDKGIEDAIKVYKNLKRKIKNLKFWIVGKEEKKGYLNKVFKFNKINKIEKDDIKYFGFVSEAEKFELLRKSWILIHPSKKEGWGLNVIEANSVGTPAVGYNVEGLRDSIRDKYTGLLSKVNPDDLSRKILLLFEDKNLYNEISVNAVKWSKHFEWNKSASASWKLLEEKSNG